MGLPVEDVEEYIVDQGDRVPEQPEIEAKSDEIEIIIEDDTPPEDQGRTPLPEDEVRALEADADEYSESIQKRFDKMTKARHDDRRRAEKAEREMAEMQKATQYYMQDAQQQRTAAKAQAERLAELEMSASQQEYQEAFDEGDSERVAKAQQRMNDASIYKSKVSDYYGREQVAQRPQEAYTQEQGRELDPATQEWIDHNDWFGPDGDVRMTSYTMGVHQQLVSDGIRQGSPEYFKRIDEDLRDTFPGKFPDSNKRHSTVVTPAGRTAQGRKVVLSESEARIAKRLGLTLKQYAASVAQMERGS